MTPQDDSITWVAFGIVVVALAGGAFATSWLANKVRHANRVISTSGAVTTRRPAPDAHGHAGYYDPACGICVAELDHARRKAAEYTERPETDLGWMWHCAAGCGAAVLFDYDAGLAETCGPCGRVLGACEAELGGAA